MSLLSVSSLGKAFRSYSSEWIRVARWFGFQLKPSEEHWVLRDINFKIHAGEAIGIVGQNGAGKSTLLKIITGTLQPTEGQVQVNGRIAAILELGMGFNPDLTGRQNAYHGLGLMGYTHADIEQVMPELENFAEVGEYFDVPVRTYSSGMQMRVAFAVVTAFRPEILIVDEALSVGDSYFQHKSFSRIREFQNQGTTLLIVSHDQSAIQSLCNRVILLDKGGIRKDGPPDEVLDYYHALCAEKENAILSVEQHRDKAGWLLTKSGTGEARIKSLQLLDAVTGHEVVTALVGQKLEIRFEVSIYADIPELVLGYNLSDKYGHIVWGSNTWYTNQMQKNVKAGDLIIFRLLFTCALGQGSYSISVSLQGDDSHVEDNYEWVDNALTFDVINSDRDFFIGTSWLDARFSISNES